MAKRVVGSSPRSNDAAGTKTKTQTKKKPKVRVKSQKTKQKKKTTVAVAKPAEDFEKKVSDHRLRLGSIEAILDHTFGGAARSNPQLWDRRAYLMIVGHIYERLATSGAELPTEELLKLAKTLAENRRAETQAQKQAATDAENDKPSTLPTDDLPKNFADAIRQVYGVDLESADGV